MGRNGRRLAKTVYILEWVIEKTERIYYMIETRRKTIDSARVGENIEKKERVYARRCAIQNLSLEDYVVINMAKIIIAYQSIHLSLPIRRLTSKIAWLRSVKGIISLILSQTSRNVTILDVGCGIGHLSALLSMLRQDVVGIDMNPDKHLWRYLSKKTKCQFICADARYLPFKGEKFNVVVAYAVLEHLESENGERSFLGETYRVLTKEGKFVMGGVPSKLAFTETFWGHERKFTKKSIIGKLESSMLYPIYIENEYFLPQYFPIDLLNDIWNRLAFQVVKIDKYLRILPLYHSNFMIAEKSNRSMQMKPSNRALRGV